MRPGLWQAASKAAIPAVMSRRRMAPVLSELDSMAVLSRLGLQRQRTLAAINTIDDARQCRRIITQWDLVVGMFRPPMLSESEFAPIHGFDGGGGVRAGVLPLMANATTRAAEVIQGAARRWVRRRRAATGVL